MMRLRTVAGFALFAMIAVSAARAAPPPPGHRQHTVFLSSVLEAPDTTARTELEEAIQSFEKKMKWIAFTKTHPEAAEYKYHRFGIKAVKEKVLWSEFGAGTTKERVEETQKDCQGCTLDELLAGIVEQTLIHKAQLYGRSKLSECSVMSGRTKVTIATPPTSSGIEPSFYYGAMYKNSDEEHPGFILVPLPLEGHNWSSASASFELKGADIGGFIDQCLAKRLDDFTIVPHARLPLDRKTSNVNFDAPH